MSIVLALASAIVFGVSDYAGGRATRHASVFVVTLFAQATAMVCVLVLLAVLKDPFPGGDDVWWSLGAGLASVSGGGAFYHALANGSMTVVAPLTAIVSALLPVGVGLAIGERPGALALVGVAVAIGAVALVSGALERRQRATPGRILGIAVLAGVGFGLLFVCFDQTSEASGMWPLLIAQVGSIPLVLAGAHLTDASLRLTGTTRWFAVVAGLFSAAAHIAYITATRDGLLAIVSVVTSMYPASTVALATAVDGERIHRTQAIGLAMAVAALALVASG
ncbi:MAG: DMT family transporter [Actinomycetota bacterium]|nr:DMT family transporter [Actinomycetota bacterium]